ncbi:helix-turn-helix transcriptional regulator [Dyella ginsengisoli]|uniref:helix-turn-helix transcriptional regulator n=1 Tax=Dyella ginsengisoli TaxID=363848 RepID=UPI000694B19F|nr:AlpA family phage regulatory protein [Dyella ginsengisoli]
MIHHLHTPSAPALLRMPEVIRRTGLRRSSIYDAMKRGDFPKSVPLTSTARAWHSDEIDAWIAERRAVRDALQSAAQTMPQAHSVGHHDTE